MCATETIGMYAQASMNNEISHYERSIVTTISGTVSRLTSDYDDRVSCPACYHEIILCRDNYQFNQFGSKI